MTNPQDHLKKARRGPVLSIIVYLLLSLAKLTAGYLLNSASLIADGFNNVSDIVANVTLFIGLYLASKPADENHRFGHWKIEDLASLITSFFMFTVGFQVLLETINSIIRNRQTPVDPLGAIVGLISALVMFAVYLYNRTLAKKVNSAALVAASKDNLSDALTSLGTSVSILASAINFPIIDKITAIIITFLILKTAYEIFMTSAFSLSDGFDDKQLEEYEEAILQIPKISAVKSKRGRSYGSNVYLDLVLEMNPDLSVYESHEITERVEKLLHEDYNVYDIDIHVEPAAIPEDEIFDNVYHKLYLYEKAILSRNDHFEDLLAPNFIFINDQALVKTRQDFLQTEGPASQNFKYFKMISVSQKTKLITYVLNQKRYASIWRRHETWSLIFRQVSSPEQDKDFLD